MLLAKFYFVRVYIALHEAFDSVLAGFWLLFFGKFVMFIFMSCFMTKWQKNCFYDFYPIIGCLPGILRRLWRFAPYFSIQTGILKCPVFAFFPPGAILFFISYFLLLKVGFYLKISFLIFFRSIFHRQKVKTAIIFGNDLNFSLFFEF